MEMMLFSKENPAYTRVVVLNQDEEYVNDVMNYSSRLVRKISRFLTAILVYDNWKIVNVKEEGE